MEFLAQVCYLDSTRCTADDFIPNLNFWLFADDKPGVMQHYR